MGIGNIVGGIAQGVDRGISTVSHVQDMWAKQDETKLRDQEMKRLKQPFDYKALPLYQELDDNTRQMVDGMFPQEGATLGDAIGVMKHLSNVEGFNDAMISAGRRVHQKNFMQAKMGYDKAVESRNPLQIREAKANFIAAQKKFQTTEEAYNQLIEGDKIANVIQSLPRAQQAQLARISEAGGLPAVKAALQTILSEQQKAAAPTATQKDFNTYRNLPPNLQPEFLKVKGSSGFGFDPSALGAGEPKAGGDAELAQLQQWVQKGRTGALRVEKDPSTNQIIVEGVPITPETAMKLQQAINGE